MSRKKIELSLVQKSKNSALLPQLFVPRSVMYPARSWLRSTESSAHQPRRCS